MHTTHKALGRSLYARADKTNRQTGRQTASTAEAAQRMWTERVIACIHTHIREPMLCVCTYKLSSETREKFRNKKSGWVCLSVVV